MDITLPIFICEDNSAQRTLIENTIFSHIARNDYDMQVVLSTDNPLTFLEYISAHPQQSGLYFLDIDLQHKINGMALAREIRAADLTGRIVFVTTHAELSFLTFQHRIEAMDYIIKDRKDNVVTRVQECIDIAYRRFRQVMLQTECFQLKSSMGIQRIPISDILYFETHHVPHKIILNTKNKRIEFRGSLKEAAGVSPDFFLCHKSFVVNTKNIVRLHRSDYTGEAEMTDGSIVPVGKTHIASLSKMLGHRNTIV